MTKQSEDDNTSLPDPDLPFPFPLPGGYEPNRPADVQVPCDSDDYHHWIS